MLGHQAEEAAEGEHRQKSLAWEEVVEEELRFQIQA